MIIIDKINIKSLLIKFEQLKEFIMKQIDVFFIMKTKFDDTFTTSQFFMQGLAESFILDQNRNWGEVMIYICYDVPSKLLVKHVF